MEAFQEESVPESLVRAVYRYYEAVALGDGVGISPDDDFESLQVGQEDLDDDLQRLLAKLELEMPSSKSLGDSLYPLRTIRDVVRWLEWVRQHQTA